ncbi:DNA polymerase III subunit gamma/tau [Ruminococcus sp.]|uniref:DNA polymerase III subunit gamma/tau n=1 Tax=Ruminococcus sp. TaxID=41978 RepID=UPI002E816CA3|nr:DNA polymerase III subunit gamma/tau [Ruminococcus sp.]MEE3492552.1 DNA polymerase III subunit gamma/tau [Ruminococcus sp.]
MAYQVLYRKYRPKSFDDVYGQDHVTQTLRNELRLNRVHHAYLFTGSRGTGKTTCAKILSKAVNCLDLHDGDPCGACANCVGIDSGEILDVVEMDAASNRGIDDIRGIIDEVAFAPARAKYRVYIIDEVHMLSRDAWNALLKTLEEPPAHVVFILATTEVNKIPETILSRCQRFDFHRISPADIAARLHEIADKESIGLSDEAALLIAVIADGAMRDAISLLDRCIGISSDVTAEVVRAAAGLAAQGQLFEIANCTINKNVKRALEIIDALYKDSKDMASLCEELQSHFRSLMLIKTVSKPRELVVMSDREFDAAVAEAAYLSLPDILYDMDVLARARSAMRDSVSPRTELEMALVKLCAPELDQTDEALFKRVTALEKAVKLLQNSASPAGAAGAVAPVPQAQTTPTPAQAVSAPVQTNPAPMQTAPNPVKEPEPVQPEESREEAPSPQPEQVIQPEVVPEQKPAEPAKPAHPDPDPTPEPEQKAPAQPAAPQRQKVDMEALYYNAKPFEMWQDVVSNLRHYSRAIAAAFEDTNAYVSGDYLLIETNHEIAFELLKKSAQREEIRKAVQEITGKVYKLGPYKLPEKKVSKDDVLDNFINRLKSSGVNVTEE